jgi:hypothetical protein
MLNRAKFVDNDINEVNEKTAEIVIRLKKKIRNRKK